VIRTLKLKLILTEEQKGSLLRTMELYTEAFDHAARWGFEHHRCGKLELQYAIYYEMRQAVPGLGAGLIQSAKDAACEALKRCKMRMAPRRKPHSAVRFPWKEAKVYFDSAKVSIYSVDGRIHAPVVLYDYLKKFKGWRCKLSTLIWNKKSRQFYLSVAVENKIPIEPVKGKTLGIDRGLNRVAVCSNNMFFDSSRINATRGKYAKNRQELQAKGTRSAIRLLRKQSGRERRFVTCENHRISKIIANTEFAVFALEDLAEINKCRWLDRRTNGKLRSWAYHQLERFLRYKAEELGKAVVLVDSTCTSQWCSRRGWIDKKSRKGSEFHCVKCGFHLDADLNASRIIARLGMSEASRLPIYQPYAAGDEVDVSGVRSKSLSPAASSRSTWAIDTPSLVP